MKKLIQLFLITSVFAGGIIFNRPAHANNSDAFTSVLIIDKTGSMMGRGDGYGDTIWFEVQEYLLDYVKGIQLNTKVIIYEFDRHLYGPTVFHVTNETVRDDIKNLITNIVPDGQSTAIYDALSKALHYLEENYKDNRKLIYLITDGRDNASSIPFSDMILEFSAKRGEYDHLYYIDLRDRASDDVKREATTNPNLTLTREFTKTLTLRPVFMTIPVVLDGETQFAQRFYVDGGVLPEGLKFHSRFEIPTGQMLNIDIIPSHNISLNQLRRIEEGRFELSYTIELLAGNVDQVIEVPIKLEPINIPGYVFTFIPQNFILQLNEKRARVTAPAGGWKEQ